jgi:hypothetical protein
MLWKLNFITNLEFRIWLQCFKQKIENKNILRKRKLDDREWYLALGVPTSRMAHADKERETHLQNNNKAKPEQLKLMKTDPSTWP